MVESREKADKPTSQLVPENVLPRWIRILNELIEEAETST
jgi:hypothetical protein